MKTVGVIPARYKSSRFPGKPLADICGKPMIWWVYNQAVKVKEFNNVYVATDNEKIKSVCEQFDINVIMTSDEHPTGTDRVAEVAKKVPADLYVNVQGDEPMLKPDVIREAILPFYDDEKLQVTNLMAVIEDPVDLVNFTVPKVITNRENIGIYLTRSTAPYPKGELDYKYYKQICVYGFTPEALEFYSNSPRGKIEAIEDIEILRFIEAGYKVKYIEVESKSISVDTYKDLERIRKIAQSAAQLGGVINSIC